MIQKSFQKTINNLEIIKIFFQFSSRMFLFVRYYFLYLITTFGILHMATLHVGLVRSGFWISSSSIFSNQWSIYFCFYFSVIVFFSTRADNEIMPTCKNDKDQTRPFLPDVSQARLPLHALNKFGFLYLYNL